MTANAVLATWWHDTYIAAARDAYPEDTKGHELAVGWKISRVDGTTHRGYYWGLVNGDTDPPVLHYTTGWADDNYESCPWWEHDGLCFVTSSTREASSGGVALSASIGHVVVYPVDLARSNTAGKHRAPWVVQVDSFDPVALVHGGFVTDLSYADLTGADLTGADLTRANLTRANLTRANLYGADLCGANLYGANLSYANLCGANLTGVYANRWTIWPDGFVVPDSVVMKEV